jgi:hypothetical protein
MRSLLTLPLFLLFTIYSLFFLGTGETHWVRWFVAPLLEEDPGKDSFDSVTPLRKGFG